MIINKSGITLRIRVADIRVQGRATQGVRLINLEKRGDSIASVCCVDTDPEEEVDTEVLELQAQAVEEAVDEMVDELTEEPEESEGSEEIEDSEEIEEEVEPDDE